MHWSRLSRPSNVATPTAKSITRRTSARSLIDKGGMGAVHLAGHTKLEHVVVVKLLHERVAHDRGMLDVTDAGSTQDGRPFKASSSPPSFTY